MGNFDTSTYDWRVRLCEEALKIRIKSAKKKVFIDSDSNDDESEEEEKAVKVPTLHAALQMVDEMMQFANDSLEDEDFIISLNSV